MGQWLGCGKHMEGYGKLWKDKIWIRRRKELDGIGKEG